MPPPTPRVFLALPLRRLVLSFDSIVKVLRVELQAIEKLPYQPAVQRPRILPHYYVNPPTEPTLYEEPLASSPLRLEALMESKPPQLWKMLPCRESTRTYLRKPKARWIVSSI